MILRRNSTISESVDFIENSLTPLVSKFTFLIKVLRGYPNELLLFSFEKFLGNGVKGTIFVTVCNDFSNKKNLSSMFSV